MQKVGYIEVGPGEAGLEHLFGGLKLQASSWGKRHKGVVGCPRPPWKAGCGDCRGPDWQIDWEGLWARVW
jgi:hypothetical protein